MSRTGPRPSSRANLGRIAEVAGVSKSTVSNVLNNPDVVADSTRARVQDAMAELGYVRNGAARQLRAGTSRIAGCMLFDVSNPYYAELARGAEDRLAEADLMMLMCSVDVEVGKQEHYLRLLEEQGVRGILICPVGGDLTSVLQVQARGTSVVVIGRSTGGRELCAADVDDRLGGRLAAKHLLDLGHRELVYLAGEGLSIDRRRRGVREAVATAANRRLTEITVPRRADQFQIDAAVERIAELRPRPTGVICFNDHTAVPVLQGLQRRGIAVPRDISLVGYDDLPFAAVLSPPLTTVRRPRYELGRAATVLLLSEFEPDHEHREILFEPELVVRASTAPPRRHRASVQL
jgi:LacI family transcriptional regulator